MRVPRSWLRELVDVDVPTEELANLLSMAGVAVDKIDRFAPGVAGIFVGEVLEVADVPGSDKLCMAQVGVGPKGRVQVVAGVKNFGAGDKVPVALPGARVTTLDQPVGVRKMLGHESTGMLCSAREIGVSDDHSGIVVLNPSAQPGADVVAYLGLDDDVLEFEIYPNRPDLMSVVGIAREVSVLYETELRPPDPDVQEEGDDVAALTSVVISDETGCPRYVARVVEDVSFGPSPLLVQARLQACGFRPLGNLVDATNYVLLLIGQPLHAFDLDKLTEERIVVRRARPGETLVTIDEEVRELQPDDLVIADGKDAHAIAGVMGGAASEVGPSSKRVLIESAHFESIGVAGTARRHHMRTEASARFERGSDPEAAPVGAALAAEYMRRWAGGRVARGYVDAGRAAEPRTIALRPRRVEEILGVTVPGRVRDRFLRGLGCRLARRGKSVSVTPPSWRPDLEREIDLIEEIARLYGYEQVPARHAMGVQGFRTREQILRLRVRDALLGAGLYEATLSSFAPEEDLAAIGYDGPVVRLTNPITADQERLRPSLFPGLLRAARHNLAHGVHSVRLFEIGKVFRAWQPDAPLPEESEHVAVALVGGAVDVLDLKGICELVLSEIGVEGWELGPPDGSLFHPGRSGTFVRDGRGLGRFGEVRPSVARAFDLAGPVLVGGLVLEAVFASAPTSLEVRPLPTQPPVLRDIALVLDESVPHAEVVRAIRDAGGEHLESVVLFDVYRGEQVGAGKRSLAYRLTFRASDRTLRAEEADAARDAAAAACRGRLGADVR